jgi:hypothetical protein
MIRLLAKEHAAQKNVKSILRRWQDIRKLPAGERALYSISCAICGPYLSAGRGTNHIGGHFGEEVSKLRANCVFCNIIRQSHLHFVGTGSAQDTFTVIYGRKSDVQLCFSDGSRFDTKSNEHVHVQLYSTGSIECLSRSQLTVSVEAVNSRNPFRLSYDICSDPMTALYTTVKPWIEDCIENHPQCAQTTKTSGFVPTRLIQLGADQKELVRLVSPLAPVKFVALSYCWGISSQPKTTKSNLQSRYLNFNVMDLPQTFQDALAVTRSLGLSYLWIDSICIVQDDENDWAAEASRMASIYFEAWVVVAATQAGDSTSGFLRQRKEPLSIHVRKYGSTIFEVNARQIGNYDCEMRPEFGRYPLFQRAWCLQERLLACRIIHFLPEEIYYECQAKQTGEGGALPAREFRRPTSPFRSLMQAQDVEGCRGLYFGLMWACIVRDFSALGLTYKRDTLPALSGLARSIGHLNPGKYIAGIWEKDVSYQLGWRRDRSHPEPRYKSTEGDARAQPTFSWITSLGAVKFHDDYRGEYTSLCTFVAAQCGNPKSDPFGRVTDSHIILRGPSVPGLELITELKTSHFDIEWGNAVVYLDDGLEATSSSCCSPIHYVGLESRLDWSSVTCFGLFVWKWDDEHRFVDALLLQRKPRDFEYVRVGVVSNLRQPWFDRFATSKIVTVK